MTNDLLVLYTMLLCANYNMISFEPDLEESVSTINSFNEWYEDNKILSDIDEIKKSMKDHIENQFK